MWINPVPYRLYPTNDSESFKYIPEGYTGLPIHPHPGSFGFVRKNHTHEGVDLYCPEGTPVFAVEDGVVTRIIKFTGEHCEPPSPWWHNTWSVMVDGASGIVNYGEIVPTVKEGMTLRAGDIVGHVKQVLKNDKGRPVSMLHLELYRKGTEEPSSLQCVEWTNDMDKPDNLLDPTPYLMDVFVRDSVMGI